MLALPLFRLLGEQGLEFRSQGGLFAGREMATWKNAVQHEIKQRTLTAPVPHRNLGQTELDGGALAMGAVNDLALVHPEGIEDAASGDALLERLGVIISHGRQ